MHERHVAAARPGAAQRLSHHKEQRSRRLGDSGGEAALAGPWLGGSGRTTSLAGSRRGGAPGGRAVLDAGLDVDTAGAAAEAEAAAGSTRRAAGT